MEIEMSLLAEIELILVLALSFVTGQIFHIIKKNNLEDKKTFKCWFAENWISFVVNTVIGLGALEVLMTQLTNAPINITGWIVIFYTGLNAGIASNSIGTDTKEGQVQLKNYTQQLQQRRNVK